MRKKNSKVYIFDINGMKTVPGQSLQSSITKGLCKIIMIFLILNALQNISKGYIILENDLDKKYYRRIQGLEI